MLNKFLKGLMIASLSLGLSAPGGDDASNDERGAGDSAYQIDVEDSKGRHMTVERIEAFDGEKMLLAKTRHGIDRHDQDRADYSFIPVIGKLSTRRYFKDDFVAANEVGAASVDGRVLVVTLNEGALKDLGSVKKIAVLNREFAYETRRRPKTKPATNAKGDRDGGRSVGKAYLLNDETLAILIRPFAVTDAALW